MLRDKNQFFCDGGKKFKDFPGGAVNACTLPPGAGTPSYATVHSFDSHALVLNATWTRTS